METHRTLAQKLTLGGTNCHIPTNSTTFPVITQIGVKAWLLQTTTTQLSKSSAQHVVVHGIHTLMRDLLLVHVVKTTDR